jgi:hypothetical protein
MVGIAGCGSSSGDATSLLKQTFGGTHKYESGNLNINLTFTPSGSSTVTGPITLSVSGPFQSLGTGKPPAASITLSASAMGHTGSLGFISTGDKGFVTLQGTSYQLPDATFKKYASGLNGITANSNSGSGVLSKLGVQPLKWVVNPKVTGNESVGGANTTHIKATINVAALLRDLNVILQKAPSLGLGQGATVPTNIPPATQAKLAGEIKNPGIDVWTGTDDKTARKVSLALTIPVTGQLAQLLGGLSSAGIVLSLGYGNLNQHQTITEPTNVRPYSEFTTKLRGLAQTLQSAVTGSGSALPSVPGSTTSTPSSGSAPPTSTAGAPSNIQGYAQCIQSAGSDITKMQRCASLLKK